jgi:glycosyltransferase involved in cell wall biosynthesis
VSPRFSIVYPTRHRPEFIAQALRILETQRHGDFEVVVCDNYLDPAMSCEQICRDSSLANLKYVRPPQPVGMVENWNHALQSATGDYVSYLTDKMFVLPDALAHVERAIDAAGGPEIVSWTSDAFNPASYADYFGNGSYVGLSPNARSRLFRRYSPAGALDRRGRGEVARGEQTWPDYCRGKIAFGVYRRELLGRIANRFGALFHNISPDYTSMVLGLTEAHDAIELPVSCVVSVNTDISNGMLSDTNDAAALAFLNSLEGGADGILPNLLVPGLYASLHNWVAHDFLTLKKAFGLRFKFNTRNWLVYCHEDIYRFGRRWSDPQVETEQKRILATFLESLDPRAAAAVQARIAARAAPKPPKRSFRGLLQARLPELTELRSTSIQAAVESLAAGRDWTGVHRA